MRATRAREAVSHTASRAAGPRCMLAITDVETGSDEMTRQTMRARRAGVVMCALLGATSALSAGELAAQSTAAMRADSLIAVALERARAGDTTAALKALERATKVAPKHAPAFFQRGVMLSRSSALGLADILRRRTAWQQINHALDLDRNNPFYLLELGRIRLKTPILRVEAERFFNKALRAAEERRDPKVLAEVLWELGQIAERRYQSAANRYMITGGVQFFDPSLAIADWRYTPTFLSQMAQRVPEAGELDFRKAEDHYRGALVADPTHAAAAHGLMGMLYERQRFEEMVSLAAELQPVQGEHRRLWFALGLALHRLDRDSEAERAFETGLAKASDAERRDMLNLETVMKPKEGDTYRQLAPELRAATDSIFWDMADPIKLTPANEARVEFLSRVAYADMRFSSVEFNSIGWKTDRGEIIMRYGEPPVVAAFAPADGSAATLDYMAADAIAQTTTVWWYPETRMRFVFVGPPAMNSARYAGDFRAWAENARSVDPLRFDNLGPRLHVDSVPVQVARFRADAANGRPGGTEVVIFADVPTGKMLGPLDIKQSTVETGIFLTDDRRRNVLTERDSSQVRVTDRDPVSSRSWRRQLMPGEYAYRVEARETGSGRSARALAAFLVDPFPPSTLTMSDVLVAHGITPRPGVSAVRSRDDLIIRPNAAMDFRRGDTLFIYWENYGVTAGPDGAGRLRMDVVLRTEQLDRGQALHARLLGGIADAAGFSAEGDNRVALRFDRTVAIDASDRVASYLALDLGQAPFGTYTLELTVTDLTTGRKTTRSRPITVPKP